MRLKRVAAYALSLLIIFSFAPSSLASAKNFIVRNESDPNRVYFIINGSSGNIGIGTVEPWEELTVSGNVTATDSVNASQLCLSGSCISDWSSAGPIDGSGASGEVAFWTDANTLSADPSLRWDTANKWLGIGGVPSYPLDVQSLSGENSARFKLSDGGWMVIGDHGQGGAFGGFHILDSALNLVGKIFNYNGAFSIQGGSSYDLGLGVPGTGNNDIIVKAGTGNVVLAPPETSGKVGVKTHAPAFTLDVNGSLGVSGTANVSDLIITNKASCSKLYTDTSGNVLCGTDDAGVTGSGTTNYLAKWTSSGTIGDSIIYDDGTNVGIGTNSPSKKLEVNGSIVAKSQNYIDVSVNQTDSAKITFGVTSGSGEGFVSVSGNGAYAGSGELKFMTEGSERMRITSSGNVGIGTTSPANKLDVNGSAAIGSSYVGTSAPANGLIVEGNVGIGTASPTATLEVIGSAKINTSVGNITMGTPNGETGFSIMNTNRADIRFDDSTLKLVAGTGTGPPASTSGISIDTSGNVGIGTTPSYRLHVSGGDFVVEPSAGEYFRTTFANDYIYLQAGQGASDTGAKMRISRMMSTSNLANLEIYSDNTFLNGNLGVGVSSPQGKLHVSTTGDSNAFVVNDSTGYVGIGTTSPGEKLEVSGGIKASYFTDGTSRSSSYWPSSAGLSINAPIYADAILHAGETGTRPAAITFGTGNTEGNDQISLVTNGTIRLFVASGGKIGIGTTSPANKLDVNGSAAIGSSYVGTSAPANGLIVEGNVGIGTNAPSQLLDVKGVAQGNLLRAAGGTSAPSSGAGVEISYVGGIGYLTAYDRDASSYLPLYVRGSELQFVEGGVGTVMTINNSRVGIGTSAPANALHVVGKARFQSDSSFIYGANSTGRLTFAINNDGTPAGSQINFYGNDASGWFNFMRVDNSGNRYVSFLAGNVGIGTNSPGEKLEVSGNIKASGNVILGSTMTSGGDVVINKGNNLVMLSMKSATTSGYSGTGYLVNYKNALVLCKGKYLTEAGSWVDESSGRRPCFGMYDDWSQPWHWWNESEVSVMNLTMSGDLYITGSLVQNAADYAEAMKSLETTSSGDLVVLSNNISVEVSRNEYDNHLIGIVSTNPAIVLTGGARYLRKDMVEGTNMSLDDSDPAIALAGRVPAKVSTLNGPIKPGDPVTSSPLKGVGMRATRPGPIVGKALEGAEWDEERCPVVESLDSIEWPEDDGSNPAKPCFRVPVGSLDNETREELLEYGLSEGDYVYVGKVMLFVDVGWWGGSEDFGKAVLPSGSSSVWVYSDSVSEDSVVVVTPTVRTDSVLSVTRTEKGRFLVEASDAPESDLAFNWIAKG